MFTVTAMDIDGNSASKDAVAITVDITSPTVSSVAITQADSSLAYVTTGDVLNIQVSYSEVLKPTEFPTVRWFGETTTLRANADDRSIWTGSITIPKKSSQKSGDVKVVIEGGQDPAGNPVPRYNETSDDVEYVQSPPSIQVVPALRISEVRYTPTANEWIEVVNTGDAVTLTEVLVKDKTTENSYYFASW